MSMTRGVVSAMAAAALKNDCHATDPREASEADYRPLPEATYGA
jgi:alcohol dehydrogenase class IV